MFGYVKIYAPELKVREYELYKSAYCGLCRFGGKRTSRLTRFFLSYDFVFLALVRMALLGEKPKVEKHFCPYMPKKKLMLCPNKSLEFTADVFVILSYFKLLDDKADSKGIKKTAASVAPVFLKREAEKAMERLPHMGDLVKTKLTELSALEKENCHEIDRVADCFASLMGEVAAFDLVGEKSRIAKEAGYHIGRYIYIADALDDFKEDLKKGGYNPLCLMYPTVQELKENIGAIKETLFASMNRALASLNLNDETELDGIIYNVLTDGTKHRIDGISNLLFEKEQ